MNESLVQWTLLNNPCDLSSILDFDIQKTIGQEISTDFGRIDFILKNHQNKFLIVELETKLNQKAKLDYCFNQVLRYKNIKFNNDTKYCILYANETNLRSKNQIKKFGDENDVLIKSYSLEKTKSLYQQTVKRLSLNVGLALPNPKNYTICYLRWMNKILKPFNDLNKEILIYDEIFLPFNTGRGSKTNFNCYVKIASDFELIEYTNNNYRLTESGRYYVENMNPFIYESTNVSSVGLTNEQKRLLLKILTNGNWTDKVHKINIYWFLRFLEVTSGSWLPKKYNFDKNKLEIAKGIFNVSYKGRTMQEFLLWCSNYCIELGLVEKIKTNTDYDQIILTPLGIEVNNIFSLDLTLKRNRMNLNFKYLDE